jgi:alpha-galactosidase
LGTFTRSDPGYQGWLEWKPLPEGKTLIEGGRPPGHDDPFFIVRNEEKGEYFIGHLAWSARWYMQFERKREGSNPSPGLSFKIGPSASNPLRVIAPGETIETPAVHLGHVEGDLDSAVQAMHDHIRRVLPPRKPERSHLIQFCVPGDTAYLGVPVHDEIVRSEFNEASILESIDVAAAVGAEMFVLDAWWWETSGDWVPAPSRFPRGLGPIVEYARKKGLLFGLYAEVEGGRGNWANSKIGREFPEWIWPPNALDLTRPEVAVHVESEVIQIIDRYGVDLYRHDYNTDTSIERPVTSRAGFEEHNSWRYYDAFYRIFERIHEKYPQLILQQASGGCARADLGTVSRFHETFLAEMGQPTVLRAYSGMTLALPPEILAIGIGNAVDRGHLDTHLRSVYTLATPFILSGVAPTVEELSPQHRERYLHYANIYKEFIRPLLPTCKMYHHAPVSSRGGVESSGWCVTEYAAPDGAQGWATIFRIGDSESDTYLFTPRGLDHGETYRVTFDSGWHRQQGKTATIAGWRLMCEGLQIRLEAVMSSELLLFEAQ